MCLIYQPVNGWCDSGLTFTNTTSSKRGLLETTVRAVTSLPTEFFA